MRVLLRESLAVAALLYAGLVAALYLGQRKLLYPDMPARPLPEPEGCARIDLPVGGGTVPMWWFAKAGAPTVLWFHGNGEQLADTLFVAEGLIARGLGFAAVEYPGYGVATARAPTETTIAAIARDAVAALANRGVDAPIAAGHSLGSGVAALLAAEGRARALVLIAPYTSIPRLAQHRYPFVPARWLVHDRFDTLGRAPGIGVPALIVHGNLDASIPIGMGRTLHRAIAGSQFLERSRGHGDVLDDATFDALAAFARGVWTADGPRAAGHPADSG